MFEPRFKIFWDNVTNFGALGILFVDFFLGLGDVRSLEGVLGNLEEIEAEIFKNLKKLSIFGVVR